MVNVIKEAIVRLNSLYGRGYVVSVDHKTRTFVRKPHGMKEERRSYRVEGSTVYALGHQQKIRNCS